MPQKPLARALRSIWRQVTGKGAAKDLEAGYCLTLHSGATRKALGKRPERRKSLWRRRWEAFEGRLLPPECSRSLWQGRCEGFGGRLLPNVAFWSHEKRSWKAPSRWQKYGARRAAMYQSTGYLMLNATFPRARSPCRWLGSADYFFPRWRMKVCRIVPFLWA